MNIYRVTATSEKDTNYITTWTIAASIVGAAISRALRYEIHNTAKNVTLTCMLLHRNMTMKEYKAAKEAGTLLPATKETNP